MKRLRVPGTGVVFQGVEYFDEAEIDKALKIAREKKGLSAEARLQYDREQAARDREEELE